MLKSANMAFLRHKTFIICSVTLLFPGNISRKFLNPLLFYLSIFWMYKSSASIIIFVEFYDLSYVKVQASWYIAFLRVSLRVSSLGGVGVTQKISALCKGASNVSSCVFSFIYLFFFFFGLLYIYGFWFPQRIRSDLEVGYEKSILTRTQTLSSICLKEPLSFTT